MSSIALHQVFPSFSIERMSFHVQVCVSVGDIMTIDPITLILSEQQTVMTALAIFQQHKIRHLPILDNCQQIIGVVTPEHIRQVLQPVNLLKFRLVLEAMTSEVITFYQ